LQSFSAPLCSCSGTCAHVERVGSPGVRRHKKPREPCGHLGISPQP
jgi:hypothetical protein